MLASGFALKSNAFTYGLYICDVFNITDNLIVSAGLRFNAFDAKGGYAINGTFSGKYSQNNLSPKLGIIYQPLKDKISVFANYQNGFTNVTGSDFTGNTFKPEQANQWEAGVKAELAEGLSGSASYYDIRVTDKLRTDVDHPGFSIQDANQYSKGIEADIIYNPIPGLNMLAGYGHNSSKFVRSNKAIEGKRPSNVANDIANFWISYRLTRGSGKGLGAGFGGNYTSNAYADDANTFTIPSYTLLDASLFYDQPKFRVGLKVNNIANTKSWNRWGSQPLRQFIGNVLFKF